MSEAIEPFSESGETIVLPGAGTVVDLSDGPACAQALDDLRQLENVIKEYKAALTRSIVQHSEDIGLLTFELPDGRKVEVTTRPEVVYDAEAIEEGLREAGMSEERIREIVKEEVTYKVVAKEAKKAAAASEKYAEVVNENRTEVPRTPSVTLRRR